MRPQVHVGVAQERENRVEERRRRQLDVPARRRGGVFGDDLVEDLELDRPQRLLVCLRKPAALATSARTRTSVSK
jgi:hypothetical protein